MVLIFLGLRELSIVNHLEENKDDLIYSTEIADHIMETKFGLRTEQLAIMELIEQSDLSNLEDVNNERQVYIDNIAICFDQLCYGPVHFSSNIATYLAFLRKSS